MASRTPANPADTPDRDALQAGTSDAAIDSTTDSATEAAEPAAAEESALVEETDETATTETTGEAAEADGVASAADKATAAEAVRAAEVEVADRVDAAPAVEAAASGEEPVTEEPAQAGSEVAEPQPQPEEPAQAGSEVAEPQPEASAEQDAAEPAQSRPRKRGSRSRVGQRAKATAASEDAESSQSEAAEEPEESAPTRITSPRRRVGRKAAPAAAFRDSTTKDTPAGPAADAAQSEPSEEREEPEQAEAGDEAESSAPATAAIPTFGLLFQAPTPVPEPRRRARAARPVEGAADEIPQLADLQINDLPETEEAPEDDDATVEAELSDDLAGADEEGDGRAPRRRRRRGGRGRRRGPGDDGADEAGDDSPAGADGEDDTEDESAADRTADASGAEGEDADDEPAGTSSLRRRTRRRRRSGSALPAEDPPGTVTRVREPRSDRDSATAIRGSTRLEAKRQRRREGREAGRRRTIITEAEFLARRESVARVMVVRQRGQLTQIGVLEDGVLVEHYISGPAASPGGTSMAGNVYLGRVQNVLPSMEAAFVDIGKGRNAVLYAGEVNWDAAGLEQHKARRIENALSSGQSVLVQVTKDPIGHKGARLTSQVSLPGRYFVYVPDGSMTGISRKLPDTERARLKKILRDIVPENAGVIVRTAAEGASEEELRADVERLTRQWQRIGDKAATSNAPSLLHGEPDLTVRVVRDVFNEDFTELIVSGDQAWETISSYVEDVAGDLVQRLTRWTGERDIFAHYRIDEQLAKALDRKVWLPSGGSLVIDRTEAMTVIDVNTGKFTGSGGNLEETVTKNNIEAAEEIVRQLRLRDIGGIIVIDFIDMVLESNRHLVIRRLLECLGRDRTKHQVAEVTSLGLVQMTRKRVGAGLVEAFSEPCDKCNGRGLILHAEPQERSGRDNANRDSASRESSRSRGKRGRDIRPNREQPQLETPPTPSGPTPAQIAAAAYAAAVQANQGSDAEGAPADEIEPIGQVDQADQEPTADGPVDSDEAGSASEATKAAEAEAPAAPASRGRRRASRRAVRKAASAPAGAPGVGVFVAAEDTGSAEVAQILAAPSGSSEESGAPVEEPAESGEGVGRRRGGRRGRVVAPAGPPAVETVAEPTVEAVTSAADVGPESTTDDHD